MRRVPGLLLTLLAGVLSADAAPVPVAPPPKLESVLVGRWQQDCMVFHGVTEFRANGTYEYLPENPEHAICRGTWWVDGGGDLRLGEMCYHPNGTKHGPYDLTVTVKRWDRATVRGTWLGSTFALKRLE